MLETTKAILSFSDFTSSTNDFLDQMRKNRHPVVLTIKGKAKLVVQDAASLKERLDRIAVLESLEGIRKGVSDLEAGRSQSSRTHTFAA